MASRWLSKGPPNSFAGFAFWVVLCVSMSVVSVTTDINNGGPWTALLFIACAAVFVGLYFWHKSKGTLKK